MNILVLTKMKPVFLKKDVKSVYDYLRYDYFFEGFCRGFKELGHNVHVMWDESFFLKPILKLRYNSLYSILYSFFQKIGFKRVDKYLFSKKIADYCSTKNIHVIFTEINNFISPNIIKRNNSKVLITQWFGIFPCMSDEDTLETLGEYDIIWSPCEYNRSKINFKELYKFKYIGCSVNEKYFFYDYDSNFAYDIVFVGGIGEIHSNRVELLEKIAKKYDRFVFYGYGVERLSEQSPLRNKYRGWADVNIIRKLYSSSKIALNLTLDRYDIIEKGFNSRLFEIAACNGAVQLVKNDKKILEFFTPTQELVTFNNLDDLFTKIDFLLSGENYRQKLCRAAYEKAKLYSYNKRAKIICSYLMDRLFN